MIQKNKKTKDIILTKTDKALLKELGFKKSQSSKQRKKIISNFNMRQLDRLKMMLGRIERRVPDYAPTGAKKRVFLNRVDGFAEAVDRLF